MKALKWLGIGFVLLIVIGAVAGGGSESSDSGSDDSGSEQTSSGGQDEPDAKCKNVATDDCTPHVGPNGSVRVDALVWSVDSVETAETVGDMTYGLGEEADGTFVIVRLTVKSKKDETAAIASETVQLASGGTLTEPDDEAAIGLDEATLIYEEVGPDATKSATVIFDVPPSKLNGKTELRFGELGFGSTEGFIALPKGV
jgi:hypothetical protein